MKIVMVSRYPQQPAKPRGGVESVTVILANAIADLGEDSVKVVTLERDHSNLGDMKVAGMNVLRLPRSRWPQVLDMNMGPSRSRIKAAMKQLDPTIVHFHEAWGLGAIPAPCPQVFTLHGFDSANLIADEDRFSWIRSKLWRLAELKGLAQAKYMISISPYVTEQIRPHTKATIHEIDNPVDLGFFSIERKEEEGRVLTVGWISARKNTLMSVKAFAKSFHAGLARKLVIAGTSREEAYLASVKAEIAKQRLDDSVEFTGQLDRHQLKVELSRAAVSLLPSLQENAPMAVSEAMATGVPVITSDRCGMPYMVEDGKSGFLIEPDDEAQIVDRLNRVLGDAGLRRNLGARGQEIARSRFHPEEVARKTLRVYRSVLGERCESVEAAVVPHASR